jgi:tetratricopeptide (TPR) repeat protein
VAHVRLGAVRLERGDAVAGSKEIEAGSNMAPDLAEGHHWLGRTLLARGEAPGALAQLKRSVDMSPGNATYLMHLAVAQERTSMLMDAVETYQKAIAADPNLLEAQERFGLLYAGNDRCDLASPIFEKALKLAPTLSRLKLDLADCRLRTRRPAEAVRLYQEVADADPKQPGVHYRLARAIHETKGMGTALGYYEKAAAAEKDNPMPFLYLGYAYKERGAKAKAVQAFKSYLSIKADAEDRADIVREIEDLGGTP